MFRERAGDTDEPHLALVAQLECFWERTLLVELGVRQAAMELHEVEVVRLQQTQRTFDTGADVLGRVEMLAAGALAYAPALRGEEVLSTSPSDGTTDEIFAAAVVDRRIDEVDTRVEHSVENRFCSPIVEGPQLHRSIAMHREPPQQALPRDRTRTAVPSVA